MTCTNIVSYTKTNPIRVKCHRKHIEGKTMLCDGKIYAHVVPWVHEHEDSYPSYDDGIEITYECSKCKREVKIPDIPTDEKSLDDFLTYFVGLM